MKSDKKKSKIRNDKKSRPIGEKLFNELFEALLFDPLDPLSSSNYRTGYKNRFIQTSEDSAED